MAMPLCGGTSIGTAAKAALASGASIGMGTPLCGGGGATGLRGSSNLLDAALEVADARVSIVTEPAHAAMTCARAWRSS
jgi:hypothetical protein